MNKACPRCDNGVLLPQQDSPEGVTFYRCDQCDWQFTQGTGESVHDRWLSPLSIVLYSQIFEPNPETTAEKNARLIVEQNAELIPTILEEIERELQSPTQQVSEILDLVFKDETKLRSHLRELAKHLRSAIQA